MDGFQDSFRVARAKLQGGHVGFASNDGGDSNRRRMAALLRVAPLPLVCAVTLALLAGCTSHEQSKLQQAKASDSGSASAANAQAMSTIAAMPAQAYVAPTRESNSATARLARANLIQTTSDGPAGVILASGTEASTADPVPPNPLRGNQSDTPPVVPVGPGGYTPASPAVPRPLYSNNDSHPAAPGVSASGASPPGVVPVAKSSRDVVPAVPGGQQVSLPTMHEASVVPKTADELGEGNAAHTVHSRPHTAKNSGVPFDPEKENGKYFVDWPNPELTLVFTGRQDGYMEPCGCAGLERMKGGMSRRDTMLAMLRNKGWNPVSMDVGGIAKGFGKQSELKFQFMLEGMTQMHYQAIGLGLPDFQLPPEEVLALIAPVNNQTRPFICGNVGLFQIDDSILPRTEIIIDNKSKKKIGVTSVVGKSFQRILAANKSLQTKPPEQFLDAALPMLKAQRVDQLILLAYATQEESIALAQRYPYLDFVVTMGGGDVPPATPEVVPGGAKVIEVGEKGMYAIVVGLYPGKPAMRYQRVALDSRYKSSPKMTALMSAYQFELKSLGLSGLGIHALPHPQKSTNGDFVGSDACQGCHPKSYAIWQKSGHAVAFKTLQQAVPPREFDPECVSCHVVGWHPTKFFPYISGYETQAKTPKLINVGCEDCHGPGEVHVKAMNGNNSAAQRASQLAMRLTVEEAQNPNSNKMNCRSCHDQDNSPEFNFQEYWKYIEHHESE